MQGHRFSQIKWIDTDEYRLATNEFVLIVFIRAIRVISG